MPLSFASVADLVQIAAGRPFNDPEPLVAVPFTEIPMRSRDGTIAAPPESAFGLNREAVSD